MNAYQEHYNKLNEEQKKAVDATEGPLLILAGPGTGKTQLLSVRAANLILNKKVSPENILILTFTNAAARTMRERLAKIVGHEGYNVEVETFHSFANSVVLESEKAIDYVKDKIEITEVEKVRTIQHILDTVDGVRPLRPFGSPYFYRTEIEKRISELKRENILPGEFKELVKGLPSDGSDDDNKRLGRLRALAIVYERYEKLKEEEAVELFDERGRIDFDDMILVALDALKKEADLASDFAKRYRYIMVDEYQDTNEAQLNLLFAILDPAAANLCCVGDDDQAIFRFQGATLSNFRKLGEKFPGLRKITLKKNYRSVSDILQLSAGIISQLPGKERMGDKKLEPCREYEGGISYLQFQTEEEELAHLVGEIKRQAQLISKDKSLSREEREKPFNNIAILVRKREQIQRVIQALLKAGIPYATDGKEDIRGEKRVRQMIDILELVDIEPEAASNKSLALYKVLTADYIGAAHSDVLKLIKAVNEKRRAARDKGGSPHGGPDLFQEFQEKFFVFSGGDGAGRMPSKEESDKLPVAKELGLKDPHALHKAAWAIKRLLMDPANRPVHDMLMGYIDDARIYRFILEKYGKDGIIRVRDLRALVSFVNMVKQSDLSRPAMGLRDFMEEMGLREVHGMPVRGELATMSQDGVRVYTAHSSKGLEFYAVFMPFCLQNKSWPNRGKPDIIPLPAEICRTRERADENERRKELKNYDELRLFYVASTRAKAYLSYTATPEEKVIVTSFLSRIGMDPGNGSPNDEEAFLAAYLRRSPEKDAFESTNEVLKDIVSRLTLNPTSLNNYIRCRRKFLYDNVLMLPERKSQQLTFGSCVHKALEEVYKTYMDTRKFPPFKVFRESFLKELKFQGVNDTIKGWCVDRLGDLEEWYRSESLAPAMPLDLENKLEITIGDGIQFRGTFDKVESDGTGGIKVVDYKTGKPDEHIKDIHNCKDLRSKDCDDYFRQLVAYKMLYDRSSGVKVKGTVVKGVLQFLEPVTKDVAKYGLVKGSYIKYPVELSDKLASELERIIESAWKDMQDLKFERLPGRDKELCEKCDFDGICWG